MLLVGIFTGCMVSSFWLIVLWGSYTNIRRITGKQTADAAGYGSLRRYCATYRIALLDKPTIVWDFHSLMLCMQMMFSLMVTDQDKPIRICKHCSEVFVASRPSAVFAVLSARISTMFTRAERKIRMKDKDGDKNA